jgi:hypothetical protein
VVTIFCTGLVILCKMSGGNTPARTCGRNLAKFDQREQCKIVADTSLPSSNRSIMLNWNFHLLSSLKFNFSLTLTLSPPQKL